MYFVFKCHVLYFGIKKEWLEKSLNTFSLAANILKRENVTFCLFQNYVKSDLMPSNMEMRDDMCNQKSYT